MNTVAIDLLMTGYKKPLTPDGETSAIRKQARKGPVAVSLEGLDGDEHAYQSHGGPDKAILHCAVERYGEFGSRFPDFVSDIGGERGGFGENISTRGMTEDTVCVGDRYRIESRDRANRGITVEVTGFRQPCWKLGYNTGVREIPRLMQDLGCPCWYYRVLETGAISAGDGIALLERPYPEWPVTRLVHGFYGTPLDRRFMEEALAIPVLGQELREVMKQRLVTGVVEDWNDRLYRD